MLQTRFFNERLVGRKVEAQEVMFRQVTLRYGVLNLSSVIQTSVKMATVQQKARMARFWFHESKSTVSVQRIIWLEYRNCRSPDKNSIKHWYEQLRSESLPDSCTFLVPFNFSYQCLMKFLPGD
ncbi:hypothetical protein AVEN_99851-1 [Araneus ventricosus]|uniref:DUF4817 domain-containing protein n=1 Tax=Araneus ventricosus TaxID=182803 RepID=A0A4Y2MHP2_ARAVE|nr:hypothetical protein AVEN_99851-1 [Araneus ventricosus]